jgi:flagellar assembly protein FliH
MTATTAKASEVRPSKYLFDVEFGRTGRFGDLSGNALAAVAEAEKVSFRQGFEAAKQEAEQKTADVLNRIATEMHLIVGRLAVTETRLEREAIDVAHAIATQLAPALIARQPLAEIEALVLDVLSHVRAAPHVAVRVSPEMAERAGERLKKIAEERGFANRLVILPEASLMADDCLVEWADGGVSRDTAAIAQRIGQAIENYLGASANAPKATENEQ